GERKVALSRDEPPTTHKLIESPFPHVVFDDFVRPGLLDQLQAEFPPVTWSGWKLRNRSTSLKKRAFPIGAHTQAFVDFLNGPQWCDALGDLFGFPVFGDRSLQGGGWHCIPRGGFLERHVDFNIHPSGWRRRLNLLFYLGGVWPGGALELGDKVIETIPGRCVIFETSDISWHGHPQPLDCPADEARRSIAMYYYDNGDAGRQHGTIYRA
ncbi:MAG: 2OG-Fe(II) oxygenase, partial [Gammaproteobacteria bacterium]|nr:2OG-Fe(II) oxygenase [Gammaproteobacteria bacterium]